MPGESLKGRTRDRAKNSLVGRFGFSGSDIILCISISGSIRELKWD